MTRLAPVVLDDLTFADLTSATIDRIPSESGGQWTLHAPVDPGITLIELFAYLLDQRLYWMGQVPDAALRGIFKLLGEAPATSIPASTVMRLEDSSGAPAREVPAGIHLSLVGSDPQTIFTTADDLTLLPVQAVGVRAGGVDRTQDLAAGRGVEMMSADGGPAEADLVLALPGPLAAWPGGRAAVLLRLAGGAPDAQWLASGDAAAPPAQITWSYPGPGGQLLPLGDVEDGTGGLRRSGVVRFDVPANWTPDTGARSDGLTAYSIHLSSDAATWTAPPQLLDLVPNAVFARHAARERLEGPELDDEVAEWLPLPGLIIDCDASGLLREDPATLSVSLRERDGEWHDWEATSDLAFAGPGDRLFMVDRTMGVLRFGDGLTGRIPVPADADPRARVGFEVGGGSTGNLGAQLEWEALTVDALGAHNAVPASGGQDPETMDAARERIASMLSARERAVTAHDHETLAIATPGVDIVRAHAAVGFHPALPCTPVPGAVTVFVVPGAPRDVSDAGFVAAPVPDPGALAAVRTQLDSGRLLTAEVFVRPPRYRRIRIAVSVSSEPSDAPRLQQTLSTDLRTYLDPIIGGDDRNGWPFGEPVRPSALLRRADAAVGPEANVIAVAVGIDGAAPQESCRDVEIGSSDLVYADEVVVRWIPESAAQGGLL